MKTNKRGPPILRKSVALSQNHLHDPALADQIVKRSGITYKDLVVEIGPGTGILTEALARASHKVYAIEKDPAFAARLKARFADAGNVVVIEGDALNVAMPATRFKLVSNIPFNITSQIITWATDKQPQLIEAHVVIQREAAQRVMGLPHETLHALMLKPWFMTEISHFFERRDFQPAPSVDSMLLTLRRRSMPLVNPIARELYQDFVCYCFAHGSPRLYRVLEMLIGPRELARARNALLLDDAMTPKLLTFEMWLALFCLFVEHATPGTQRIVAGSRARLQLQQSQLQKRHRTTIANNVFRS